MYTLVTRLLRPIPPRLPPRLPTHPMDFHIMFFSLFLFMLVISGNHKHCTCVVASSPFPCSRPNITGTKGKLFHGAVALVREALEVGLLLHRGGHVTHHHGVRRLRLTTMNPCVVHVWARNTPTVSLVNSGSKLETSVSLREAGGLNSASYCLFWTRSKSSTRKNADRFNSSASETPEPRRSRMRRSSSPRSVSLAESETWRLRTHRHRE